LTAANAAGVREICRSLEGSPLALELAAARVRVLGVRGLADRLGDRLGLLTGGARSAEARHRTLRATVNWSYELLPVRERAVLSRLSVFPARFDLAAAGAVAGLPPERPGGVDILDVLGRLVDRSLVVAEEHGTEVRYRLLETVRQFAAERLTAAGATAETERRHLEHYLNLPYVPWQARWTWDFNWLGLVHLEYDNFRMALRSAIEDDDAEVAYRLAAALVVYWLWAGVDGADWLARTVSLAVRAIHPATAEVLTAYAANWPTAGDVGAEGVRLAEDLGDPKLLALICFIGATMGTHRDPGEPARLLERCERLSAETAFTVVAALCHYTRAWFQLISGEYVLAVELLERALHAAPPQGPGVFIGPHLFGTLGVAAALAGDFDRALAAAAEAVAAARRCPLPGVLLMALARGVATAVLTHDWPQATSYLREQLTLLRRLGTSRWVGEALEFAGLALAGIGQGEAAAQALAAAERHRAELGEATGGMIPAVAARLAESRTRFPTTDLQLSDLPTAEAALSAAVAVLGAIPA
jgi:hypothetical protein